MWMIFANELISRRHQTLSEALLYFASRELLKSYLEKALDFFEVCLCLACSLRNASLDRELNIRRTSSEQFVTKCYASQNVCMNLCVSLYA